MVVVVVVVQIVVVVVEIVVVVDAVVMIGFSIFILFFIIKMVQKCPKSNSFGTIFFSADPKKSNILFWSNKAIA